MSARAKKSKALGSPEPDDAGSGMRSDGLQAHVFTVITFPPIKSWNLTGAEVLEDHFPGKGFKGILRVLNV